MAHILERLLDAGLDILVRLLRVGMISWIAGAFALVGVGIVIGGYLYTQAERNEQIFVEQTYSNFGIELISIGLTVLVIQSLERRASVRERKAELILQMGSPDNGFALEAVRLLRHKGWLTDGSLRGADLAGANLLKANLLGADLSGASLQGANLMGVDLWGAILKGANLFGADLSDARFDMATMGNATLPDGTTWTRGTDMAHFTDPSHPNFWRSDYKFSPAYDAKRAAKAAGG